MVKYDDASWPYGGDFPEDLPNEAGATHAGMFVAWAFLAGLTGELHLSDFAEELEALRRRQVTPGAYFLRYCDGKFTDEDLNEEGNAFAEAYFDFEKGQYISDYDETLTRDLPSTYHVADTWENFDQLRPALDRRFREWKTGRQT